MGECDRGCDGDGCGGCVMMVVDVMECDGGGV